MNDKPETVEEFLARGKKIEYLPIGQCNWDALSNRAKINPTVREDEVAARRLAQQSAPILRTQKAAPERRPTRACKEDPNALAPTLLHALDTLVDGDRIADLARRLGKNTNATWQLVLRLKERGKIRAVRVGSATTWHRVP